jgi:hypothetical protein
MGALLVRGKDRKSIFNGQCFKRACGGANDENPLWRGQSPVNGQ